VKSLTDYDLQQGDALIYISPLCAVVASLDYPESTMLSLELKTLVLAYMNQWGFLLSAYHRLYKIHLRLSKADDQTGHSLAFTEYDYLSVDLAADIRDYAYILVISMTSIFDFYACLIEAVRKKEAAGGRSMIGFAQFKNTILPTLEPESLAALQDRNKYPIFDTISEIRNRIVHRGYSIRTNHSFRKEDDLPLVLFQGNDYTDQSFNFSVGRLFEDFYETIRLFEQLAASALPMLQPDLQSAPTLLISYKLEGETTFFECKEIGEDG
jgi:hypothetical protein